MNAYCWRLDKYARSASDSAKENDDNWQVYDSANGDLHLTLTKTRHLIVTSSQFVEENYSLWNSQNAVRAVSRGDSMLVIVDIQKICRRFRVKFSSDSCKSGLEHCADCANHLSKFIYVKKLTVDGSIQQPPVMSGTSSARLPLMYQTSNYDAEDLALVLPLCLGDSNFPLYVAEVESQLNQLTQELQ